MWARVLYEEASENGDEDPMIPVYSLSRSLVNHWFHLLVDDQYPDPPPYDGSDTSGYFTSRIRAP